MFLKQKHQALKAFCDAKQALESHSTLDDKQKQDLLLLTERFISKCQDMKDDEEINQSQNQDLNNINSSVNHAQSDFILHEELPSLDEKSDSIPCARKDLKIIDQLLRSYDRRATPTNKIGKKYK